MRQVTVIYQISNPNSVYYGKLFLPREGGEESGGVVRGNILSLTKSGGFRVYEPITVNSGDLKIYAEYEIS